ncbi:hypothetical protein PCE1_002714 [Barthelona sp. PCE]
MKKSRSYPPQVTEILQESFNKQPKPNPTVYEQLGRQTGLQTRQVRVWFQNRRSKLKKKQEKQQISSMMAKQSQSYDMLQTVLLKSGLIAFKQQIDQVILSDAALSAYYNVTNQSPVQYSPTSHVTAPFAYSYSLSPSASPTMSPLTLSPSSMTPGLTPGLTPGMTTIPTSSYEIDKTLTPAAMTYKTEMKQTDSLAASSPSKDSTNFDFSFELPYDDQPFMGLF